jgi:hypothetical protein
MSDEPTGPVLEADYAVVGEQRQADRRGKDRRAPRHRLDPLFAATLVRHVVRPETPAPGRYPQPLTRPIRQGLVVNVRA